ncbi:MAG: hypothetical protein PHP86_04930 [Nevskiales bacterium]|nr:hypothetical protein [Nevskiales bacterium]
MKFIMMGRNPVFSGPSRLATGTLQSSKYRVAVSEQRQPIFFRGVRVSPGVSPSITSSETPPIPDSPVRTAVVMKSARIPEVMKVLLPETR